MGSRGRASDRELRVERDLDARERARYRARRLRLSGEPHELLLVKAWHDSHRNQRDLGQGEPTIDLLEADTRGCRDLVRWVARLGDEAREGHREAAGVPGADELLRIRVRLVTDT